MPSLLAMCQGHKSPWLPMTTILYVKFYHYLFMKPKLLLHTCCAPCAGYVVQLLQKDYDITGYFYNPNIHPEAEYQKRFEEEKKYFNRLGLELIEGPYDMEDWFELTKGHEHDLERGERCWLCYRMRLEHVGRFARENGFDSFTTTLSLSPHKDANKINQIGQELAESLGIKFFEADFKKDNGFKKSLEISHAEGFYRQNYCGCVFSQKA